MALDIDITQQKSRDIIKILENYPQGHLEIKFERVFWCSDYAEPQMSRDNPWEPGRGAPRPKSNAFQDASQRFKRASDTLGSMMGP